MKNYSRKMMAKVVQVYTQNFFILFGASILVKHFLFGVDITREMITSNIFSSLFTAVVFVIIFWSNYSDEEKATNSHAAQQDGQS